MLIFVGRYLRPEKPPEQGENQQETPTTHTWLWAGVKPGTSGGMRVLPPMREQDN